MIEFHSEHIYTANGFDRGVRMQKGDTVVCIDGEFHSRRTDPYQAEQLNLPQEGETYTVREVVETESEPGIRLEEVVNSKFYYDIGGLQEPVWGTHRFRVIA